MSFEAFRKQDTRSLDDALEALAHRVIGAAIEVHRVLGPGLPELVYRNALSHELAIQRIAHMVESPVPVIYKGKAVGEGRLDFLIESRLIVELKVVDQLAPVHRDQVVAYLNATRLELALLINFNVPILADGLKRIIRTSR